MCESLSFLRQDLRRQDHLPLQGRSDTTARPYIEYTRKLAGKTTGRRLTPAQAEQYRAWIANRRTLDQITTEMDNLSHQAARLLTNP